MSKVDCVVVGAGVVGLAIARQLAAAGRETMILEQHSSIGSETSSRSSEVIHAGLYYPQDSLKARTCVRGRKLLYAYCQVNGVPHRKCGKLIVATDRSQLGKLSEIATAARGNGVDDLETLSASEARALEPELSCAGALLSPSTGIFDSHSLMLSLLADAERLGAVCVLRTRVRRMRVVTTGIELQVDDPDATSLVTRWLVNSAGLGSQELARSIEGLPASSVPAAYLAKGTYFALAGRAPFRRLVYPVPEPGGLGVHLTLDLAGRARFGPDVEWINSIDYDVDSHRSAEFYAAIRRYWPGLHNDSLEPAYAGIRPKISGPGQVAADFRIDGPSRHGVPGLVNLFGIESPGLTASLAIAEIVTGLMTRS